MSTGLFLQPLKTPTRNWKSGYIPTLDGWRAVAIIAVIAYHSPEFKVGPVSLSRIQMFGSQGVDLFFALSGLLICSKLLREEDTTGSISLKHFYARRAFRILPAAYLYLFVLAGLNFINAIPLQLSAWVSAAFAYTNYYGAYVGAHTHEQNDWYVAHFWTLAIEEHFYLVLPGLLVLIRANRTIIFVALVVLFTVWQILNDDGWPQRSDLRVDSLLIPSLLTLLLRQDWIQNFCQHWVRPPITLVIVVLAYALITKVGGVFETLKPLLKVVYPLLIISTVLHPTTMLARLLETTPLRWIGRISFSLYLWQQLFFPPIIVMHKTERTDMQIFQHFPSNLISLFCVASLSYYFLEKPLIRYGSRILSNSDTRRPKKAAISSQ